MREREPREERGREERKRERGGGGDVVEESADVMGRINYQ